MTDLFPHICNHCLEAREFCHCLTQGPISPLGTQEPVLGKSPGSDEEALSTSHSRSWTTNVTPPGQIYLGSPYTAREETVMAARYEANVDACATLMQMGYQVYSPIVHNHMLAIRRKLPRDWPFWQPRDLFSLRTCTHMVVLMLDGWDKSLGLGAEIDEARKEGIHLLYARMDNILDIPEDLLPTRIVFPQLAHSST